MRGTYLESTPSGEVGLRWGSGYWLDVDVFERKLGPFLQKDVERLEPTEVERLETVMDLYAGDLLEGFFEDWAITERDRLHELYVSGLVALMRYFRHCGVLEKSLSYGQRVLKEDPLREEVHRLMMSTYVENGSRALAARQYEICRGILAAQLDVEPMLETRQLYESITQRDGSALPRATSLPRELQLGRELRRAAESLEQTARVLRRAIGLIEEAPEELPPRRPEARASGQRPLR